MTKRSRLDLRDNSILAAPAMPNDTKRPLPRHDRPISPASRCGASEQARVSPKSLPGSQPTKWTQRRWSPRGDVSGFFPAS